MRHTTITRPICESVAIKNYQLAADVQINKQYEACHYRKTNPRICGDKNYW